MPRSSIEDTNKFSECRCINICQLQEREHYSLFRWPPTTMVHLLPALALAGSCSAFSLKNLVTFGDSYTDITMNGDGKCSTPPSP